MREILGNHLMNFFVEMSAKNEDYKKDLMRTYKGDEYEVHSISDELFDAMCDMSDEEFEQLAGEDAWWRSADGSNMGSPDVEYVINGEKMFAWDGNRRDDYISECENCSDRESGACEGTKEDFDDCFGGQENTLNLQNIFARRLVLLSLETYVH